MSPDIDPDEEMRSVDLTAMQTSLSGGARVALEPSAQGARLRRRALASSGLALLVLGFLAASGLGRFVAALLLTVLVVAGAVLLFAFLRRVPWNRRNAATRRVLERARDTGTRTLSTGGSAARQRVAGLRRAQRERGARKPRGDGGRPSSPGSRREFARLNARGVELRRQGNPAEAIAAHAAALELVRELGDRSAEAMTLNNLALALGRAGDEEGAVDRFDEAASILRELDDEQHEGQVYANLGLLHARGGRPEQAVFCFETALRKLDPGSEAHRRVEEQLRRAG
jgi:tetratricopeptide (TPR) repeat protein